MNKILFWLFWIVAVMVVCGCVAEQNEGVMADKVSRVSLNISTDKAVYHSMELVNINAEIYSNVNVSDATVTVKGINGRLNKERILNLSEGANELSFTYKLPKCNVCGGISAGIYNLSCEVMYENVTVRDSVGVSIQQ